MKFKRVELSSIAKRLLMQLYQDDTQAIVAGRSAKMATSQPQEQLEKLRIVGFIKREIENLAIGQVYSYSLTIQGRNYACALRQ